MRLWPSIQQWRNWSLPSKLTAIGTLVAAISLGLYGIEKTVQLTNLVFGDLDRGSLRLPTKVTKESTVRAFKSFRTSFERFAQGASAGSEQFKPTDTTFSPSIPISERFTAPARDTIAHTGKYSLNFIPEGNPITRATKTNYAVAPTVAVSAAVLDVVFDVSGSRTLDVSFFDYSTSNPRPSHIHNCDSGLNLFVQRDNGEWVHYMNVCGVYKSENRGWNERRFQIPTNNANTMKLGFVYELQNSNQEDPDAKYLIDDIDIRSGPRN
jgi:hypothetical protein